MRGIKFLNYNIEVFAFSDSTNNIACTFREYLLNGNQEKTCKKFNNNYPKFFRVYGFFIKAVFLGLVLVSCGPNINSYKYYSFCKVANFDDCGDRTNCVGKNVYEGIAKNKEACTYLKIPTVNRSAISTSSNSVDVFQRINDIYPSIKPEINEKTIKYIYDKYTIQESVFPYLLRIDTVSGSRVHQEPDTKLYGMNAFLDSKSLESATKIVIVPKTQDSVIVCSFALPGNIHETAVCDVMSSVNKTTEVLYQIPYASLSQFKEINHVYVRIVNAYILNTKEDTGHGSLKY